MDLTVPTKDLRPAIIAAADAVPRKTNVLPALTMVRIDAREDGVITIQGTDLELSILAEVRGTVTKAGEVCVPAQQLAEIAKETDDENTRIHVMKKGVAVVAGRSRFQLASMPATDYVGAVPAPEDVSMTVPADVLCTLASRVGGIAARDSSRGTLCGVLIESTGAALRMVATNEHQLALSEATLPDLPPATQRVVPPHLLAAAVKHLKDRGPVRVSFGGSSLSLQVASLTIRGQTVAGDYPKYADALPKMPTVVAHLPTAALLPAVRRIATVATARELKAIICRIESDTVRLWTRTPDLGSALDTINATVQGGPLTIACNVSMLVDTLARVSAEEVRVRFHGASSGILVDGRGDDPIRSLWMLMPLELEGLDLSEPEALAPPQRQRKAA